MNEVSAMWVWASADQVVSYLIVYLVVFLFSSVYSIDKKLPGNLPGSEQNPGKYDATIAY